MKKAANILLHNMNVSAWTTYESKQHTTAEIPKQELSWSRSTTIGSRMHERIWTYITFNGPLKKNTYESVLCIRCSASAAISIFLTNYCGIRGNHPRKHKACGCYKAKLTHVGPILGYGTHPPSGKRWIFFNHANHKNPVSKTKWCTDTS
jgi:hypothetical protein